MSKRTPSDHVTPAHERVMSVGLAMAADSTRMWPRLDRAERRELLACWTEFMANLAALGVAVPTDTAPTTPSVPTVYTGKVAA